MGTTGTNLVVVALPSKDDYVHKISSQKVPHLTLLFLGEYDLGDQTSHVVDYIQHAVSTSLDRFGLSVDRRGELGDDKADVLFFEKSYAKKLEQFRSHLLANRTIAEAYLSAEQYPTWTPHLTLGYPDSPAKPDNRDYPGISYVNFDRIALWTDAFEGPTFELDSEDYAMEVSMSQQDNGAVEEFLQHFGVKGMRWGVRRDRSASSGSTKAEKRSAKLSAKTDRQVQRADKRFDKRARRGSDYFKVYNTAADKMNRTEIVRINNKPQYKGQDFRKDSPLRRKYYKEMSDTFEKALNEASTSIIGTNASGTKRVEFVQDPELLFPDFRIVDVKRTVHADGSQQVKVEFSKTGFILSFEIAEPVEHADVEDFLAHFGVKGMKWGFRKDGVSAGRKKALPVHADAKKAASAKAKVGRRGNTKALSNDELQALVKRMNLEKQYKTLSSEKAVTPAHTKMAKSGAKFATDVVGGIAKQQATRVGNDAATKYVNEFVAKAMKK
jgi:2'-5' RNA ligase